MQNLFSTPHSISVTCSLDDLREIFAEIRRDEEQRAQQAASAYSEKPTLSRNDVMRLLGVSSTTLWSWAKCGYLSPVKIGSKVFYRKSDVDKILQKKPHSDE